MIQLYRKYETVMIVRPELGEDEVGRVWERVDGVLARLNGREIKRESWGKRKLAYEISKQKKGLYFYLRYLGGNDLVAELERNLRLMDDVLKFQTVLLEGDINIESFDFEKDGAVVTFVPDGGDESEEGEGGHEEEERRPRRDRDRDEDSDDDDDADSDDED